MPAKSEFAASSWAFTVTGFGAAWSLHGSRWPYTVPLKVSAPVGQAMAHSPHALHADSPMAWSRSKLIRAWLPKPVWPMILNGLTSLHERTQRSHRMHWFRSRVMIGEEASMSSTACGRRLSGATVGSRACAWAVTGTPKL